VLAAGEELNGTRGCSSHAKHLGQELLSEWKCIAARKVARPEKPADETHCSFCGKVKSVVDRLVAGPTVYICNECIELCEDVIAEELSPGPPAT